MHEISDNEIDGVIAEAQRIAGGNYRTHEPTARNHAALQALQIRINGELIKTIRTLDEKGAKLQKLIVLLSLVATVCALIALFNH